MTPRAGVGVFGIGLAAYWPQFEGCASGSRATSAGSRRELAELGADVVSAGLVDTAEGAREAGELLAARPGRARHALHGDVRDLVAGAARRCRRRRRRW